MTSERIKEIQEQTAYPNSVSVQQALLQVWNECQQELKKQYAINGVSNNEVALIEPLRNFIRSKHLSKEWETFLKDYERNL